MKKALTLTATMIAATFTATAEVRINGFANLVAGMTSSDDAVYGYDDKISFSEESLFAIQISGDINDKMTATGQIVARGEDDYDPDFDWAYITYAVSDNFSFSAGRLRLPLFRYSSSLDIGYSYHWVAPPQAVYDVAFNNYNGVRFDYSNYAGDWEYNIQVAAGEYSNTLGSGELEGKNMYLVSGEATYEWLKVRAVYGANKIDFSSPDFDPTINGLRDAGAVDLANSLAIVNDTGTFVGFGLELDNFNYFLSAEITQTENEQTFSSKIDAYYVTAGVRIDKFTPSITYEVIDSVQPIKFLDQVAALPPELQPFAGAVNAGLQQSTFDDATTLTLGIRYDFDTNVALKTDISRFSDDLNEGNDGSLMRVAVNYVF